MTEIIRDHFWAIWWLIVITLVILDNILGNWSMRK